MTNVSPPFSGKKAFITGSGRGIGRAIALALAQQGCDILVHYRRDQQSADEVVGLVRGLGRKAWIYPADLCDIAQTQLMLEKIASEHPTLDIYVANAASTAFKSLQDISPTHVEKTLNIVVTSFLITVQKLVPLMRGRDSQILTISGIDTVKYCPGHGLLACAKAALETLTKYLSVELSQDKIHAKCFNPGLVLSDSTRLYMGENLDAVCQSANQVAPHGGFVEPDAVARIALQLLNPVMNWMAGNTFYADGGIGFMLPVFA